MSERSVVTGSRHDVGLKNIPRQADRMLKPRPEGALTPNSIQRQIDEQPDMIPIILAAIKEDGLMKKQRAGEIFTYVANGVEQLRERKLALFSLNLNHAIESGVSNVEHYIQNGNAIQDDGSFTLPHCVDQFVLDSALHDYLSHQIVLLLEGQNTQMIGYGWLAWLNTVLDYDSSS